MKHTKKRIAILGNQDLIKLHNSLYQRQGETSFYMQEYLQAEEKERKERKQRGARNDDDYDTDGSEAGEDDFDEYESD